MQADEQPLAEDDDVVRMTQNERTVWAYLVTVVVTSGVYLALMATRLADGPVEDVSWVVPMLWAVAASVTSTVVLTVVLTVAGAVGPSIVAAVRDPRGRVPAAPVEVEAISDVRDQEISRRGDRASFGAIGVSVAGALALAMLDADSFWIGNLLFVGGTVGAIVETTTKIRLYRRGF